MGDTAAVNALKDRAEYMSVVIDGNIAFWNRRTASMGHFVNPFDPPINPAELKSMRRANASEEQRYGTCPGVALLIIETKSGNWHPAVSASRH